MSDDDGLKAMGQVIQIDEARIRDHLGEMVRGTVEETLNALLDAEADRLCGAGRYERSQGRQDTRAGSYERSLHTVAGEVNLKVPKLRRQTFETAIIERYRRRESSVEEALIEMYLAGISVRCFPDIHWQKIRTNNPLERIMKEIEAQNPRRRCLSDGQSCLNLAAARLRHIAGTTWSAKCYMNMRPLYQQQQSETEAVA